MLNWSTPFFIPYLVTASVSVRVPDRLLRPTTYTNWLVSVGSPVNNAAMFGPASAARACWSVMLVRCVQELDGKLFLSLAQVNGTTPTLPVGVALVPILTSTGVGVRETD